MARWVYGLGLVAVGGLLVFALAVADPSWMSAADAKAKLVELGFQVFVVGLLGGGIKLVLDRQTEYRAFQADILQRLGNAHKEVYRIRRLLSMDGADKAELIAQLMDARQELGAATHVARLQGLKEKIDLEIAAMRAYLESVIQRALGSEDADDRMAYEDFVDWRHRSAIYHRQFKEPYEKAKKIVDPDSKPSPRASSPK